MKVPKLIPSSSGLWQIQGEEYLSALNRINACKDWTKAADMRLEAVQALLEAISEEEVTLDFNHSPSRSALQTVYTSATDHLLIGEVETAVALWENLLDLDPEDHFEAVVPMAFALAEIEDWECLEGAMFDISIKTPEYQILSLWAEFRKSGGIERDALHQLRTRYRAWWEEFTADEHPSDEAYMQDSRSEKPSQRAEARELWFVTEPIWERNPEFIAALKKA